MNYNLESMSKDEGRYYISEKLKGDGCNQNIFEDAAIEAIFNAADGTPRLINKFCKRQAQCLSCRHRQAGTGTL